MENQINDGDQNTQQVGQNSSNQLPQTPEKPKMNYWIISTVLLFVLLMAGGGWFVLNSKNKISSQQPPANVQPNQASVTGVIRTSGLSADEKQRLGLKLSDFQMELFNVDNSKENAVQGYYLESFDANITNYIGKCVQIEGKKSEPSGYKIAEAYRRSVLKTSKITLLSLNDCNPYSSTLERVDFTGVQIVTLSGVVERTNRPSPNINYDYEIKLSEPYLDKTSSAGSPQKLSNIPLVPSTNDQWSFLENNIGKQLIFEGSVIWGYAESKYFGPTSITISAPSSTSGKLKTYNSGNFTLNYPSGWKVSTRQIEYYDSPTLELTKTGGTKMIGGYELPEIWIGSIEIYSTSGAICANEPECPKVDTISFTIKGKSYSTDVFRRQIWESGKFTGKYFFVFQIGSQSELDSVPSKPTITGQYATAAEKAEIENILSSITY